MRAVSAPFGRHSDAEWRFLNEHVVRRNADGSLRVHYDPALAVAFRTQPLDQDLELWIIYDAIRGPTLVLRGERSDVLTRQTARAMSERGPAAKVVEVATVGHSPTLIHDEQIEVVCEFLLGLKC